MEETNNMEKSREMKAASRWHKCRLSQIPSICIIIKGQTITVGNIKKIHEEEIMIQTAIIFLQNLKQFHPPFTSFHFGTLYAQRTRNACEHYEELTHHYLQSFLKNWISRIVEIVSMQATTHCQTCLSQQNNKNKRSCAEKRTGKQAAVSHCKC